MATQPVKYEGRKKYEDAQDTIDMVRAVMGEGTPEEETGRHYRGVLFIEVQDDTISCSSDCQGLNEEHKKKLLRWIKEHRYKEHTDQYWRLDFDEFILVFKYAEEQGAYYITGHLIDRNPVTRVALMEARQRYLARKFML